jgi:hypothetical protein
MTLNIGSGSFGKQLNLNTYPCMGGRLCVSICDVTSCMFMGRPARESIQVITSKSSVLKKHPYGAVVLCISVDSSGVVICLKLLFKTP